MYPQEPGPGQKDKFNCGILHLIVFCGAGCLPALDQHASRALVTGCRTPHRGSEWDPEQSLERSGPPCILSRSTRRRNPFIAKNARPVASALYPQAARAQAHPGLERMRGRPAQDGHL